MKCRQQQRLAVKSRLSRSLPPPYRPPYRAPYSSAPSFKDAMDVSKRGGAICRLNSSPPGAIEQVSAFVLTGTPDSQQLTDVVHFFVKQIQFASEALNVRRSAAVNVEIEFAA